MHARAIGEPKQMVPSLGLGGPMGQAKGAKYSLNLADLKKEDFQDEFLAKAPEFSESWR